MLCAITPSPTVLQYHAIDWIIRHNQTRDPEFTCRSYPTVHPKGKKNGKKKAPTSRAKNKVKHQGSDAAIRKNAPENVHHDHLNTLSDGKVKQLGTDQDPESSNASTSTSLSGPTAIST